MTDPKRTTPNPMPVSHVVEPGKELFASPDPREVDAPLFAPNPDSPTRIKRKPAPRSPRWRDEDMPLRSGDVIAVGLRHGNSVAGQVAAANDHCFRLNLFPALNGKFTGGLAVIMWSQVVEFGPVAARRGAGWDWEPLAAFRTAWTEARK